QLRVDVPGNRLAAILDAFEEEKLVPRTEDLLAVGSEQRYSAIWFKSRRPPPRLVHGCGKSLAWYEDNGEQDLLQLDVRMSPAPHPGNSPERLAAQLAQARKDVAARPEDRDARFRRPLAAF